MFLCGEAKVSYKKTRQSNRFACFRILAIKHTGTARHKSATVAKCFVLKMVIQNVYLLLHTEGVTVVPCVVLEAGSTVKERKPY